MSLVQPYVEFIMAQLCVKGKDYKKIIPGQKNSRPRILSMAVRYQITLNPK